MQPHAIMKIVRDAAESPNTREYKEATAAMTFVLHLQTVRAVT
jgi:hypothetical protein